MSTDFIVSKDDYLKDIDGIGDGKFIIRQSFRNLRTFLGDLKKELGQLIERKEESYMEPEWISCNNKCEEKVNRYIDTEMNSTAYILRCLGMSMINEKLHIECSDQTKISGVWEKDAALFTMKNFKQASGRLIMGFGPSASGKTYWAKNVISMLHDIDNTFPTVFISIDGGTYREASAVYQTVLQSLSQKNVGGFKNLVSAGFQSIIQSSMFSSGQVKKIISLFLKSQAPPNLYVPETLGGCLIASRCSSAYSKYKDLTRDKSFVGLCIWQHVEDTKCVFGEHYKCIGCTESGKERERKEGKKYSADAWSSSFKNGMVQAKTAEQWFIIHNTGGRMYKLNGKMHPCINLIESNVKISTRIQDKYNAEVYKEIKIKI